VPVLGLGRGKNVKIILIREEPPQSVGLMEGVKFREKELRPQAAAQPSFTGLLERPWSALAMQDISANSRLSAGHWRFLRYICCRRIRATMSSFHER
jgi:hypothetical protein